jgi:hypothetical protein
MKTLKTEIMVLGGNRKNDKIFFYFLSDLFHLESLALIRSAETFFEKGSTRRQFF